jgi:hypothetical protein
MDQIMKILYIEKKGPVGASHSETSATQSALTVAATTPIGLGAA